ncbi:MAG: hypothetical protein KC591_13045 [Gemmatimonadetes bacterium]|nr:hypothetical protein [Gemmatimonadota bacterium]
MDLRRPAVLAALLACALGAGACSDGPPTALSDDAIELPATLLEAKRLADRQAADWSPTAQLLWIGGGFTVLDADGRGRNHTFFYYARFGLMHRRLDMHLFSAAPWAFDRPTSPPAALLDLTDVVDTDVVVPAAIAYAESINVAHPDSIPIPESFAARLSAEPAWPEPQNVSDPADSVAWRVDFLVEQVHPSSGARVWYSTARFYFQPRTAALFGTVVPDQPQLYPYPSP